MVQKEFLGAISGKNKPDLLAALKREIFSDRESRLRQKGFSICKRNDHSIILYIMYLYILWLI